MNLAEVFDFVPAKVRDATRNVARQLESLQVLYAVAGGLAVGAHGYVRSTTVVEFLVGDEAYQRQGGLVSFKPGIPIQSEGVMVDYLSGAALGLPVDEILANAAHSEGIPIVPIEILVQMKLIARRRQDQFDVIELVKAGADAKKIRAHLARHADDLLPLFEELLLET